MTYRSLMAYLRSNKSLTGQKLEKKQKKRRYRPSLHWSKKRCTEVQFETVDMVQFEEDGTQRFSLSSTQKYVCPVCIRVKR